MVSVIIPTFNRANTIVRSVNSVLSQTCKDIEIIIVDDNSIDNTEEIIKKISSNRIKFIKHTTTRGACSARNTGINAAQGEYIAFQDSDDEWFPSKLEKQLRFLQDENIDVTASSYWLFNNNTKTLTPKRKIYKRNMLDKILMGNYVSTQTILGKTECFKEVNFDEDLPRFQDWELMIRILKKYKFSFMNEPLVNVFLQDDSISKDPKKVAVALKLIINKHKCSFASNKKKLSELYRGVGLTSLYNNKMESEYFLKAFYYNKYNLRNFIFYCYIKFYLLKTYKSASSSNSN